MEREEEKDVERRRYRKEEQYVVLKVCERGKRDRKNHNIVNLRNLLHVKL